MITYADIRSFTADDAAGTLYPLGDKHEWWTQRGVVYEDLERFCIEFATDTVENVLPYPPEVVLLSPHAQIAAFCAMSTEVGFMLGWLACERSRA